MPDTLTKWMLKSGKVVLPGLDENTENFALLWATDFTETMIQKTFNPVCLWSIVDFPDS